MIERSPSDLNVQRSSPGQVGSFRTVTMAPNVGLHKEKPRERSTTFVVSVNSRKNFFYRGGICSQGICIRGHLYCLSIELAFIAT